MKRYIMFCTIPGTERDEFKKLAIAAGYKFICHNGTIWFINKNKELEETYIDLDDIN